MTTIAYRDGWIVSDRLAVSETGCSTAQKLFRVGDSVVGIAGRYAFGLELIDYALGRRREPPEMAEDDAFEALCATPEGVFIVETDLKRVPVLDPFCAIGTGAPFALGAMHAGASARQAVAVAAKCDPFTGSRLAYLKAPTRSRNERKRSRRNT